MVLFVELVGFRISLEEEMLVTLRHRSLSTDFSTVPVTFDCSAVDITLIILPEQVQSIYSLNTITIENI